MVRKASFLFCFMVLTLILSACGGAGTDGQKSQEDLALNNPGAMPLYQAISSLAEKLVTSTAQRQIGKIAVADFAGPADMVTPLGEHISDKMSVKLFASGRFVDFMERRQLKQVLLTQKVEHGGAFDQKTVQRFGKMIGVDAMVIGLIEDLGGVIDVTVKIVESGSGRLLGMADVQILKDESVRSLLAKQRLASLTISVEPRATGKVTACGHEGFLHNGMVTFADVPFGNCAVVIHPDGHKAIHRNVNIRSTSETLAVRPESKRYDVSFQIIPADAQLTVDGQAKPLNQQGFARVTGLLGQEYSFVIAAKDHKELVDTFNPSQRQTFTFTLGTDDKFLQTKNKFAQKVQAINPDFKVRLWTNKTHYRMGDEIVFSFQAERDCYLNLVDINSQGEMTLLFPNRFYSDNRVRGGRTYSIPDSSYGFKIKAQPPAGTDRVYAIVSTQPLNVFQQDFSSQAFLSIPRGTRGLGVVQDVGQRIDHALLNGAAEHVITISN